MSANTAMVLISESAPRRTRFWPAVGRGWRALARAIGRGGLAVGEATASAYRAIDPDVRTHLGELPLLGMTMLLPRPAPVRALPDDGYRPLVFVHGLGGRPGNFLGMKTYFRALGRRRVYLADLSGAASFEEMVERLRELIERVVVCNGLGPNEAIDVVTHSMGGLVARLALRDPAVARRVHTLLTLGAPHSGTYLARFAATRVTSALRPRSRLVRELARDSREGLPDGVRVVACWSPADVVILPAEGARLAGAENIEMPGLTHYGYLIQPRCWRAVFEILLERPAKNRRPPTSPTSPSRTPRPPIPTR